MSIIDKNINDKPLNDVLVFWMERVMRQSKKNTLKVFKEKGFNVTKSQWVLLKKISETNGITQKELADATFKEPAAVTRTLDLLVQKGLLTRSMKADDRRAFEVLLSPKGIALVTKMTPEVQKLRQAGFVGIEKEEIEIVKSVLKKMYGNLTKSEK